MQSCNQTRISMALLLLLQLLCLSQSCSGRHTSQLQEEDFRAGATKQKRSSDFFELLQGEDEKYIAGVEKLYNDVVDEIIADFANADHVNKREGNRVSARAGDALLSASQHPLVNNALSALHQQQCPDTADSASTMDQQMFTRLAEKQTCLSSLSQEMSSLTTNKVAGRTVKQHVMAAVTCNMLPRLLDCFTPSLLAVSNCSSATVEPREVAAARTAITDLQRLLQDYCYGDAHLLLELMRSSPSKCVSDGVTLALKYVGPSFLADVTAVKDPHHLPCEYVNYVSSVLGSVLGAFCQASTLTVRVVNIAIIFNENSGCSDIHNIH